MMEYTIVIGVIVFIMMAMSPMIKRGIQSLTRVVADQIGNQEKADQDFDGSGHLDRSYTVTRSSANKQAQDRVGNIDYTYTESTFSFSNTISNLGFTQENQ